MMRVKFALKVVVLTVCISATLLAISCGAVYCLEWGRYFLFPYNPDWQSVDSFCDPGP